MNTKLAIISVLCFTAALFLSCCCGSQPPSPGTSSSTGGCAGTAKAGEPCAADCDCCGHACTTEHVCSAPCLPAP